MKRIFAIVLIFIIICSLLVGCAESQDASEGGTTETVKIQYLTEVNGVYTLTLPKTQETIVLRDDETRFVPYITNELVEIAEAKILEDVAEYDNHSGFFLQITEDYLCLVEEVIVDIEPESYGEYEIGGFGYDHQHLFFSERISTQAVKDPNKIEYGVGDEDYKKIQFFPQPTPEFKEEKYYDISELDWTLLSDDDMDVLRQVYNGGKNWTDNDYVDRLMFHFDGRIRFATEDSVGWMHFGFDDNVLYYNGMYTSLDAAVKIIIENAWKECKYFSYKEVLEMYSEETVGVQYSGFKNTDESPVNNEAQAIERAKNECVIEWNMVGTAYDSKSKVWSISFGTKYVLGGCQTVYLDENGKTLLIVFGE